jgi:hypothetical protein
MEVRRGEKKQKQQETAFLPSFLLLTFSFKVNMANNFPEIVYA